MNNLPYSDIIFILSGNFLDVLKRKMLMDMILDKCIFQISFINFSNICCWYTLELPHREIFLLTADMYTNYDVVQQLSITKISTVIEKTESTFGR